MIKAHSSGRIVSSSISDVVITSVHSEKTRLNKLMMTKMIIIIIMKKRHFKRSPETDYRHETQARKMMVDFKFDALYRQVVMRAS